MKHPGQKCQGAKRHGPKRQVETSWTNMSGAKRPGPKCQGVKRPDPKRQYGHILPLPLVQE